MSLFFQIGEQIASSYNRQEWQSLLTAPGQFNPHSITGLGKSHKRGKAEISHVQLPISFVIG